MKVMTRVQKSKLQNMWVRYKICNKGNKNVIEVLRYEKEQLDD